MPKTESKLIKQFTKIASMHLILWACVLSLSVSPRPAHAELTVDVRVRTTGEPQAVTGFIVTRDHTSQRAVKNYRRASDGTIVVTIPLEESEATGFAVASAMIKDKNGLITFGELRPTADPTLRVSFVDIPQCEIPELDTASSTVKILSQMGSYDSLLQIREARRNVKKLQLEKELKGEFLEKLRRLESAFGLIEEAELSPDLNPYELTARLYRLRVAVESYQIKN